MINVQYSMFNFEIGNEGVKCESLDGQYPIFDIGMGNDEVNDVISDLENRLIDFAARVLRVASKLPTTVEGNHLKGQIVRSSTSPAPNYGEAQSAESRADFIHKLKILLKELREAKVWLKIIIKAELLSKADRLSSILQENDELIRILHTSVKTAGDNSQRQCFPMNDDLPGSLKNFIIGHCGLAIGYCHD